MRTASSVTELIGNTPLVKLGFPSNETGANIFGKCEFMNPTGSVKDRIGYNMVRSAINDGTVTPGKSTVIEPTSGNTGIALASVCAALNIDLILTMPESMSIERRKLMSILGARLELTPAASGMKGAIAKAEELQQSIPDSIILQQFKNPANPQIHRETTALEILRDTGESVDIFVAAIGTGGTITGTGEVLRQNLPDIQIYAVEPADSPILSGGKAGVHKIQGIGAGFVPDILNTSLFNEVVTVTNEEAIETAKMLARQEGLLVGISSGANVCAAMKVAKKQEMPGKSIVTILCDTAERYLSTSLFEG